MRVQRDPTTTAFFDGTARGEFLIVQDLASGEFLAPQFDVAADPDRYRYVAAVGTGTVVSWAVVHERGADGATRLRPVGIVELDEGPWWWTELVGADPAADLLGCRVQVTFEPTADDSDHAEVVPAFVIV